MKKLTKGLLALALIASNASLNAATNKTFLLPRSQGVNLPMEYTTWNELLRTKNDDRFGANFQLTGFYQDSAEKSDIGKYFGIQGKNYFLGSTIADTDLAVNYLIHDGYAGIAGTFANATANVANFKLEPEQTAYGVRIDYHQDLEKLLKGLYLKVSLPIVNVENKVRFRINGVDYTNGGATTAAATTASKLVSYFNGSFNWTNPNLTPISNLNPGAAGQIVQDNLKYALFTGKKSTTGVADIDVILGYNFVDKEKYFVGINIGVTIPTGDDANGNKVFEALVGNGDHWGLGAGFWAGASLWTKNDQNIKLSTALNYRYLFEHSEKRTLGIDGYDWGQYALIGKLNTLRSQTFVPAANLLTQNVKVELGSQLDAIINLAYNNGGFSIDLGYNIFWRDSESVKRKDSWTDNTYGILYPAQGGATNAADLFAYSAAVVGIGGNNGGAEAILNNATNSANHAVGITTKVAESPSQTTNKIYGGLGYMFKEWEYPLLLGIGAAYEFANRDAIENWQLWGKLGIAF